MKNHEINELPVENILVADEAGQVAGGNIFGSIIHKVASVGHDLKNDFKGEVKRLNEDKSILPFGPNQPR